ncbi:MAG: BatD family protein [Steroidobacteraceae bacterium]
MIGSAQAAARASRQCASILVLALLISSPASAAVRAYLSANNIVPGDTVQLTLEHDGRSGQRPDLSPLNQDFDVLGTRTGTQVQITNGSMSASTDVEVTLSPKHAGALTVPSITWGNERSPALILNVSGASGSGATAGAGAASAGNAREFVQTEIEPAHPYVQAAVQLTVRLYASERLYRADLQLAPSADVLVEQVGADQQSTAEHNGQAYRLITRHYLLFPQRSGRLQLAGPVLDAEVADAGQNGNNPSSGDPFAQLFGASPFGTIMARPIRLHGDPIVLNVRPRPAGANARYWLPATGMTLTSQWSPVPLQAHAGDPVTVKLHLQATGLTAAQLPDLSSLWQLPPGLKAYPDQAKLHDAAQGSSVAGSRDQTIALIGDQPGHFTIPALAVQWWDTTTNSPQRASIPARTLVILPAGGGPSSTSARTSSNASASAPSATPPRSAAASSPAAPVAARAAVRGPGQAGAMWRWIAAGLALLWLLTLGAWLWSWRHAGAAGRRGRHPTAAAPPDQAQEHSAFRQACSRGDARTARRHLLAWGAARWPATPPAGLGALARLLDDASTTALLRELDRACYAAGPWRGEALAERLAARRAVHSEHAAARRAALAPLYP